MPAFQNITGEIFGRLTVIERAPAKQRRTMWKCRCACGNTCTIDAAHLKSGWTRSCGCLLTETIRKAKTHGMASRGKHPVYKIWKDMKRRCENPNNSSFAFYGGRGIKVCERWHEFTNFFVDMGDRPTPQHTLDRIDNDGDYEPGNVRWATRKEQRNNQRPHRNAHFITAFGMTLQLSQWAQRNGIDKGLIWHRLRAGWTPEQAVQR